MIIPDQTAIWNRKHAAQEHEGLRDTPSPFSEIAELNVPRNARILELGCGVGRDAIFFTQQGHQVLATDASEIVIEQDQARFPDSSVAFEVLDMRSPFPFPDDSFDVVYANLSLHYFGHEETRQIVERIAKVLRKGGVFAFSCKSVDNAVLGQGREVEKDMFISETGHVRHLFSESYTRLLLNGHFQIEYLKVGNEDYNGTESNILQCIATKSTPAEQ